MCENMIYLLACLVISLGTGTGPYSYLSTLQCLACSRCLTNCISLYEDAGFVFCFLWFFFPLHNAYKNLEENFGTI